jgi:hypothetical protein
LLDFDTGYWILDTGFWILDTGFWILDTGFWILDTGFWILDTGYWILVSPQARWILDWMWMFLFKITFFKLVSKTLYK